MRLKETYGMAKAVAKVYWDAEWREFVVKFYVAGKHQAEADYFTEDSADAHGTAAAEVKRMATA